MTYRSEGCVDVVEFFVCFFFTVKGSLHPAGTPFVDATFPTANQRAWCALWCLKVGNLFFFKFGQIKWKKIIFFQSIFKRARKSGKYYSSCAFDVVTIFIYCCIRRLLKQDCITVALEKLTDGFSNFNDVSQLVTLFTGFPTIYWIVPINFWWVSMIFWCVPSICWPIPRIVWSNCILISNWKNTNKVMGTNQKSMGYDQKSWERTIKSLELTNKSWETLYHFYLMI